MEEHDVDLVINCAAYTNVDKAEAIGTQRPTQCRRA